LAGVAAASWASGPAEVTGFTHVRSVGKLHEYRLDANGLTVLLAPERLAPVVAVNVTYRVGSRNEVTGSTGATHFLEHLMFKGTEAYNDARGNSVKQYVEGVGGEFSAVTTQDYTSYVAILPRRYYEGYLAIEADRMRNLRLRPADLAAERTVVRNENERAGGMLAMRLRQEVVSSAYRASPYAHPTGGWKSDVENVTIDKLGQFYASFYWPNNATLILAGDLEVADALQSVRKHFGRHPKSPRPVPVVYTREPEQIGIRRVTVKLRGGGPPQILIAHKIPSALHADLPALVLLDRILSQGEKPRFTRGSAETELRHDLALHWMSARVEPKESFEAAERAILDEIQKVREHGVTAEEVAHARERDRIERAFASDLTQDISSPYGKLSGWIGAGDWSGYYSFPEAIARVTAADIQRVARTHFSEDQRTIGWYVPAP
jgi:zinc protease